MTLADKDLTITGFPEITRTDFKQYKAAGELVLTTKDEYLIKLMIPIVGNGETKQDAITSYFLIAEETISKWDGKLEDFLQEDGRLLKGGYRLAELFNSWPYVSMMLFNKLNQTALGGLNKTHVKQMNEQVKQMYAAKVTEIRRMISLMINTMRSQNPFSRQYSLAITDLQRAFHTLGESKKALGLESPYKESYNPNSPVIEPQEDYHSGFFSDISDLTTQVEVVKAIRAKLKMLIEDLKGIEKDSNSEESKEFRDEISKARMWVREAKNWMGWELRALEIEYNNRGRDRGDSQYVPKPIKTLPEELPTSNGAEKQLPDVSPDAGMILKEDSLLPPEKVAEAIAQAPIEFAAGKAGTVSEAKLPDANHDIEKMIDEKKGNHGLGEEGNVTIKFEGKSSNGPGPLAG